MTLKVHHLRPAPGAKTAKTRKGRGEASKGKTAGRGTKGQNARTNIRASFEGGQTPLARRLPKRGFTNKFAAKVAEVNVGQLEAFAAGAKVDEAALRAAGLVKGACDRIKVLGKGELTKSVTVTAHSFSKSAQEKIAKAGGKVLLVAASAGE